MPYAIPLHQHSDRCLRANLQLCRRNPSPSVARRDQSLRPVSQPDGCESVLHGFGIARAGREYGECDQGDQGDESALSRRRERIHLRALDREVGVRQLRRRRGARERVRQVRRVRVVVLLQRSSLGWAVWLRPWEGLLWLLYRCGILY